MSSKLEILSYIRNAPLLITDWSGVMSDDRQPVYQANVQMLEMYGLPAITFQEWLDLSHSSAYAFLASQGVEASADEVMVLYSKIYGEICREAHGATSEVYPDAYSFLQKFRKQGKRVVVVSSHPHEHLLYEADRYELTPFIDHFMGGHTDKVSAIGRVLQEWGGPAWYLGDTIYDVQMAKKAGIPVVSITTGYHTYAMLAAEEPDHIVHSLSELGVHFN